MRRGVWMVSVLLLGLSGARAEDIGGAGKPADAERPLVQLALLLDTSNSMDGMIQQAKTQLWSIVNEFVTAKRAGQRPVVQVALYRYGTPALGAENGYIKQLLPLTDDLDKVSDELFRLTTHGGDEYCGWVIQNATNDLAWSTSNKDYKAIFIAGNETFAQGKVDFREACKAAITKGIVVNTIHCEGAEDTFWDEAARLGDGRFMHIDQNRQVVQIQAPQDAEIATLSGDLNKTYVAYGARGKDGAANQAAQETNSASLGAANLSTRAYTKANAQYRNGGWDLVDAAKEKEFKLEDVKEAELPTEMQKMTAEERKAYVETKAKEREKLQARINDLVKQRTDFVAAEEKKQAEANKDTLGNQVRAAVREQAEKREFKFK
ncbi:MAG: VWA domain-containing protein [Planctomycetota bacterium]|nr:VWA domain-containing protein [Planctomycetota bacterium]